MEVLLLGGPLFLGRALIDVLLARSHRVTLLNRGRTNPELYPELERILGDRSQGMPALGDRRWDAVIDNCGYLPRTVGESARALRESGRYLFVSTISVYEDRPDAIYDEDAPLAELAEPTEEVTGESYGALKALCEEEVRAVFGDRATIVRPGLIVGPHDPSDRFTYWPVRIARGGRVLAPEPRTAPVCFIDVRDLAEFCVTLLEGDAGGTFNADGPIPECSFARLLAECEEAAGSNSEIVWAQPDWLASQGVRHWTDLPLWLPPSSGRTSVARGLAAGLSFRSVGETVRDTLAWAREREAPSRWGLSLEREAELLGKL